MFYKTMKLSKIRALSILLILLIILFAGCASSTAVKQTKQEAKESLNLITDIGLIENPELLAISIKGTRLLAYTSVKQPKPLCVTLYFPGTALGEIETALTLDSDIVASIKASELTENGHTSRIKIALKKDASYEVTREGNGLKISFAKTGKTIASAEPVEKKEQSLQDISDSKPAEVSMPATISLEEDKDKKPAFVNRVDFSSEDAGKSTVIIGTTKPVKYKINKAEDKRLKLILFNTNLPDYRKRPLITTRFNSAVDRITPIQTPALKDTSMILIELRESVPYYIEQADDLLFVHFDASSMPPKPVEKADLPTWKKVVTQAETIAITDKAIEETKPEAVGKYTGEKIALDFYDTDIKNVFRILMEISRKNFAIDKDVNGKVTLTLAKPVPWDQALDLILKMNQLGQTYEGDIIRIATLETIEEQKALGPLVTEYIAVNYSNVKTDILPHLEKILTKDRGSVTVDERTNLVVMTDVAENIKKAREIVKNIDKVTPQVMIEARIVEASDKFARELGVDWNVGTNADGDALINNNALGGKYGYNAAVNFPFTIAASQTNAATLGFSFARTLGSPLVLNAAILAHETQGDLKVISSPKILTLDNVKATITQGLEYPIVTPGTDGGPATTELEDLLLELTVTPHVTSDNRISMVINIKKRDLGNIINGEQSFTKKEAITELLVDDGNTIVIGGIIKQTKNLAESRVPWLSKIPILGWLFKTEYKTDDKEELLIFITPKIVQLEQQSNDTDYKY